MTVASVLPIRRAKARFEDALPSAATVALLFASLGVGCSKTSQKAPIPVSDPAPTAAPSSSTRPLASSLVGCPSTGPCRILALGDSITYGAGGAGGGYRVPLFRMARERNREVTFVGRVKTGPPTVGGVAFPSGHEGYPGYTIAPCGGRNGILPLVPGAMASANPHVVLLMIGTNDVDAGCDLPSMPARLGALVDAIFLANRDTFVMVANLVPSQDEAFDARALTYGSTLPGLVSERAHASGGRRRIAFVDMTSAFRKVPDYRTKLFADMLHPNDAGYAVMADVWATALFPKVD
jgi:lysophospholipase L1-like esterase